MSTLKCTWIHTSRKFEEKNFLVLILKRNGIFIIDYILVSLYLNQNFHHKSKFCKYKKIDFSVTWSLFRMWNFDHQMSSIQHLLLKSLKFLWCWKIAFEMMSLKTSSFSSLNLEKYIFSCLWNSIEKSLKLCSFLLHTCIISAGTKTKSTSKNDKIYNEINRRANDQK